MELHIISTVGVSLFTNLIKSKSLVKESNSGEFEKCLDKITHYRDKEKTKLKRWSQYVETPLKEIGWLETYSKEVIEGIKAKNWKKSNNVNTDASAEIQSIIKIIEEAKLEKGAKVKLYFVATDTAEGCSAARIVAHFFSSGIYKEGAAAKEVVGCKLLEENPKTADRIKEMRNYLSADYQSEVDDQAFAVAGLQVKNLKEFQEKGLYNLLEVIGILSEQASSKKDQLVLNISGGYKAMIPVMTVFAQILSVPIKYIYEESDELFTLEQFPIDYDWDLIMHEAPFLIIMNKVLNLRADDSNKFYQSLKEGLHSNRNNSKIDKEIKRAVAAFLLKEEVPTKEQVEDAILVFNDKSKYSEKDRNEASLVTTKNKWLLKTGDHVFERAINLQKRYLLDLDGKITYLGRYFIDNPLNPKGHYNSSDTGLLIEMLLQLYFREKKVFFSNLFENPIMAPTAMFEKTTFERNGAKVDVKDVDLEVLDVYNNSGDVNWCLVEVKAFKQFTDVLINKENKNYSQYRERVIQQIKIWKNKFKDQGLNWEVRGVKAQKISKVSFILLGVEVVIDDFSLMPFLKPEMEKTKNIVKKLEKDPSVISELSGIEGLSFEADVCIIKVNLKMKDGKINWKPLFKVEEGILEIKTI